MSIFQKAERRKAKLKLALCGPSGSGKTFSALLMAKGMNCGRIAMIDTENDSGQLYCDIADYDVAPIAPPFSVEKYIGAIKAAETAGYSVLIIDSLTHAWSKAGGILDEVDKRKGNNAFTNGWREATPMHDRLIDTILQSPLHIIVTMRAKTAYEIEKDEKGKSVPVKKGMEPIQRAGLEYEFTVVLDMDNTRHTATSGKDRTRLFDGQCFIPNEATGVQLMQWLEMGVEAQPQYYQPQQWQQPYQAAPVQQPALPFEPAAPVAPVAAAPHYGFPAYEAEIVNVWTQAKWPENGIPGWVQARYGRQPDQLTAEECYAILNEFTSYVNQKTGGQ